MSQETSISWADATWNPVRGCTRVSNGCRHCYAERMAARNMPGHRSPTMGKPFARMTTHGPRWTGDVELIPSALDWPLRLRRPAWVRRPEEQGRKPRIFVNSMSDLFHEKMSNRDIAAVYGVMAACQQFEFVVLTKRPERAEEWYKWRANLPYSPNDRDAQTDIELGGWTNWPLPNLTLGVSVEDQETADQRIPILMSIPAAKRIVSYEPALGEVDFGYTFSAAYVAAGGRPCIDGIIFGGESGPGARPCNIAWARSTRDQCKAAGVAFWCKQLGALAIEHHEHGSRSMNQNCRGAGGDMGGFCTHRVGLRDGAGADPSEWPADLRVQEWPA